MGHPQNTPCPAIHLFEVMNLYLFNIYVHIILVIRPHFNNKFCPLTEFGNHRWLCAARMCAVGPYILTWSTKTTSYPHCTVARTVDKKETLTNWAQATSELNKKTLLWLKTGSADSELETFKDWSWLGSPWYQTGSRCQVWSLQIPNRIPDLKVQTAKDILHLQGLYLPLLGPQTVTTDLMRFSKILRLILSFHKYFPALDWEMLVQKTLATMECKTPCGSSGVDNGPFQAGRRREEIFICATQTLAEGEKGEITV